MTKIDALHSVMRVKKYYEEKKKQIPSFEKFAAESIMNDVRDRSHIKSIFRSIYDEDRNLYNDIKKHGNILLKNVLMNLLNMKLTGCRYRNHCMKIKKQMEMISLLFMIGIIISADIAVRVLYLYILVEFIKLIIWIF